jgi:hypothetical protein
MRTLAYIAMAALSGGAALGQNLLDCIEPDVLRTLLMTGQGERPLVITAAVPPELAVLKMPGGFAWIGSAERITGRADANTNISQVTAAWRSSLVPDAARNAMTTALTASGWAMQPQRGTGFSVFSSSSTPTVWQAACRDGKPVSLSAVAMDGVTYVTISIQRGNNNDLTCNSQMRMPVTNATGLEKYMPHLELPADPATGVAARMGGGGSGSSAGTLNARAEFVLKDSLANVARHFAKQMAAQGWNSDANWSGASTAGSSWSRRDDSGTLVQGMLKVTALEERQFLTELRVLRLQ